MAKVSENSIVAQASFEDQGCSEILTEATSSSRRIQNNQNEVASEIDKSKKNWIELRDPEGTQQEICEEHTLWSRITQSLEECIPECIRKTFGDRKKNRHILRLLHNHIYLRDHGKKLVPGKLIAEGGQAQIYEAEWENKDGGRDGTKSNLVFKVFKQTGFDPRRHCPLKELRRGNQGHFTAICHGVTQLEDGRFAFVFDKYWGDLATLIRKRRQRNPNAPPFFLLDAIRTMLELARGMRNLHRLGLLHRDLKCSNILIDCGEDSDIVSEPMTRFSCNIADYESSLGTKGTGFWRAPEILRSAQAFQAGQTPDPISPHTEKADVYAYAMTCYQVLTGRFPLEGIRRWDYDAILIREQRPALPDDLYPWIRELLQRCWHTDPSERPAFHEIEDEIIRNRVEATVEDQERSEILRATSSSRIQNTSHRITYASEVDVEFIEQSTQHCQSELRHHEHTVWSRVTKKFQTIFEHRKDREVLDSLLHHNMCLGDHGMDFVLGKLIAEGGQAEIYEAEWANKSGRRDGSKCNLVFKVFKNPYTLQDDCPLEMLRRGNQGHFTAICHGVTQLEDRRVAFVFDKYWGDLETLIRKRRERNPNAPPFFLLDAIRIMLELARGMRNLHMKGILHGDLKPANILVDCRDSDEDYDIVSEPRPLFACNISTSKEALRTRFSESLRNVQATQAGQAPDPILSYTEKADVYSYAMTCYQVLTGPIDIHLRDYDAILIREQRPALPDDLRAWISELLQKCWHTDPSKRPAFHEIEDDLIRNGL